ncbi:stage III sporulation protein SpoIIIAF [Clostridium puniceum]|uniref:Stage III sporulation protein SpoIIIAF n=1 Tax=Clostridium puniceum TaxID=29367 RepID=A0A1S8TUD9_9CLOT|nr:stage III sporulation protein AF [Clostridium puniceum]OOM80995.1 stage III sporulation protein SpoIIIAF [Clostridium puniceum]
MFIETLKNIVITLVTMLIFISAVELISPNNKMKKYIKFILGLILISVILNPIIEFISNGEKNIAGSIESYEAVFSQNKDKTNLGNIDMLKANEKKEDSRKTAFINNFNKNCDSLLKNQFKNMIFKSEIDCDVNFTNITLKIKKLKIGVGENKINKIKKIVIKDKEQNNEKEVNKEYAEIIEFAAKELKIPKEKIEVYKLEE